MRRENWVRAWHRWLCRHGFHVWELWVYAFKGTKERCRYCGEENWL